MDFVSQILNSASNAVHDLGKGIASATKNPLVDMAAAAALDYFTGGAGELLGAGGALDVTGSAAANAALLTGGIAGLASGNLGQGLMAGLAGYGGASLGEGLGMGHYGVSAPTTVSSVTPSLSNDVAQTTKALTQGDTLAPSSVAGELSPNPAQGLRPSFAPTATDPAYSIASKTVTPMPGGLSSLSSADAAKTTLWQDFKGLQPWQQAAIVGGGALGLKALTTPQKLNAPNAPNTQYIRYYNYAPMGGYTGGGIRPAVGGGAATGGLVALANGGSVEHYDDGGAVATPITATDVANYLQANPGMSDAQISAAMNQYHVDPGLVAQATGLDVGAVQSRYNAADPTGGYATGASGVSNNAIDQWLGSHAGASDATIANAMQQYGVTPQQMANATGIPLTGEGNVADRYALAQNIMSEGKILGQAPTSNPFANDVQWAQFMDTHKDAQGNIDPITVHEMARVTGLSDNEVLSRYNAAEALLHPVKPITPVTTPTTTTGVTALNPATTATPMPISTAPNVQAGVGGTTGAGITGGGTVINPNGTVTISPVIPNIPPGGFTGMQQMVDAYTKGGGSPGYTNPVYHSIAEFNAANDTMTGGSKAAFDYLNGKSPYPTVPYTPTGEIYKPYQSAVLGQPMSGAYTVSQPLIFDPASRTYKPNPNYDPNFSATKDYLGSPQTGITANTAKILGYTPLPNGIFGYKNADGTYTGIDGKIYNSDGTLKTTNAADGGLMGLAGGGMTVGHLGGYSDGGRLLRGPGDGVSDSIPATIGTHDPEPARLADGEFVVPARIVSELGNGSTEAGARQLYKMMDRIQNARRKTIGKNAVATNTKAHKYLPA